MEITNLSTQPTNLPKKKPLFSIPLIIIIISIGLALGFWISRFEKIPKSLTSSNKDIISIEEISDSSQIETGKTYGNNGKIYKDTAMGVVEKGSINGVGTHILNRDGGDTQRISLISSSVDLDLFIDRKIEVKGETNASSKTAWLLDVGVVTVLE
jgi:hypothetical protein